MSKCSRTSHLKTNFIKTMAFYNVYFSILKVLNFLKFSFLDNGFPLGAIFVEVHPNIPGNNMSENITKF